MLDHTDTYPVLASSAAHCLLAIVHDPVCLIDLLAASLYLAAAIVLVFFHHRWLLPVYLALAASNIVAALAHASVLP